MNKKLTIKDLLNEKNKDKSITHELIKEDLEKITPKQTIKSSFYDMDPITELEKNLKEVISNNSITQKRKEKNILFEFDRKMQRINKIKSKTYRRMRRKEKAKLREMLDEKVELEESTEEESSENKENSTESEEESSESQNNLLKKEVKNDSSEEEEENFDENKEVFTEEKKIELEKCEEQEREIVLPGWGTWGGEGIETIKNKINTIKEVKEGIKRDDLNLKNVIINPNNPELEEKYLSTLPSHMKKSTFNKKINIPVSKECNSLRVFNLFVKSKNKKNEEVVEEFCYEPMDE